MFFPFDLEWATHMRGLTVVAWVTATLFAVLLAVVVLLSWARPPGGPGRHGR